MTDSVSCSNCGTHLRKGSTFCIKCGTPLTGSEKLVEKMPENPAVESAPQGSEVVLPEVDEWDELPEDTDDLMRETMAALEDTEELMESSLPEEQIELPPVDESLELPPEEELSWEEETELIEQETVSSSSEELDLEPIAEEDPIVEEEPTLSSRDLAWETPEEYGSEIKEGMPFKEVSPPKVVDGDVIDAIDHEVMSHLFTDAPDDSTREAVTHLFPRGRGDG